MLALSAESSTKELARRDGRAAVSIPDRMRILVVEDDETIRAVTLLMLDRLDLRADVVASGIEALAATRAERYDVVLMDIQIPEMDGMETTRRIRSELSETLQPFIIAMTAGITIEDQIFYLQLGMDDLLTKPFHMEELALALNRQNARRAVTVDLLHDDSTDETRSALRPAAASIVPISLVERLAIYDPAPLDTLMADLGRGGGDLRRDLIKDFVDGDDQRCAAITAAGHDTTGLALAFIAHGLKSAGATLGLQALSNTAVRIEFEFRTAPEQVDVAVETSELIAKCLQASAALRIVLRAEIAPCGGEPQAPSFGV